MCTLSLNYINRLENRFEDLVYERNQLKSSMDKMTEELISLNFCPSSKEKCEFSENKSQCIKCIEEYFINKELYNNERI